MPEFVATKSLDFEADAFTIGYKEAVEWLLPEPSDEEPEWDVAPEFAAEALDGMKKDCAAFQKENAADLALYCETTGRDMASAGVDFWLTRNGHGAGFWDRGTHPCLEALTKAAHAYGNSDPYVGDDGMIYLS